MFFRRMFPLALALILGIATVTSATPALIPTHAQDQDTIIIGMTDLPSTLDPGEAYDFNAWETLSHLYTGLTRQITGSLDVELALAASYRVSDDKLTYTFTLVDGAAFSDGTPITAQTFVDSIDRVLALRRDATQAVEPYVDSVEAVASGELVFHLVHPAPYFLQLLALPPYFPQHPTLAETRQPQPFADSLIGNGPYKLDRFDVHEQIVLTANPVYSYGPPPATPRIVLRNFARSQDLRDALRNHEIDVAWRDLFLAHLFDVENTIGLNVIEVPSTRVFYLYMGETREPTDDPLVRQAITLLIQRGPAVEDVFQNHVSPLTSLVPLLFSDAYAPIWPEGPDIPQAESILRAASYSDRLTSRLDFTIVFSQWVYGDPYTAAVTRLARDSFNGTDFIEYGVFSDIDPATFFSMIDEGSTSFGLFAWTPIVAHPDAYLRPLLYSTSPIPANGDYASPQIDALLDDALLTDDPAEQGALYREVADWVLDDSALIPIWQDHVRAIAWDDIDGIHVEPNYFLHYDQLVRR